MAGKVIKSRFVLLSKFSANGLESASKTATSHIRKTLPATVLQRKRYRKILCFHSFCHSQFLNAKILPSCNSVISRHLTLAENLIYLNVLKIAEIITEIMPRTFAKSRLVLWKTNSPGLQKLYCGTGMQIIGCW